MRTKQVYQTDSEGYFIGLENSFESPLEPNVFLIPAGAVEVEPPSFNEGQRVKWNKDKWEVEDIPEPVKEVEVKNEPTKEELEIQAQESLIQAEIRAIAIERLKSRGEL